MVWLCLTTCLAPTKPRPLGWLCSNAAAALPLITCLSGLNTGCWCIADRAAGGRLLLRDTTSCAGTSLSLLVGCCGREQALWLHQASPCWEHGCAVHNRPCPWTPEVVDGTASRPCSPQASHCDVSDLLGTLHAAQWPAAPLNQTEPAGKQKQVLDNMVRLAVQNIRMVETMTQAGAMQLAYL
jgi:hypothetical protein